MTHRSVWSSFALLAALLCGMLILSTWIAEPPASYAQGAATFTPTFTPPATPTLSGPVAYAPDQLNIRSGPALTFPQVGLLVIGQSAPLLGRNDSGAWLQVEYLGAPDNAGWVSRDLVQIRGIDFQALEVIPFDATPPPPPTPSPPPEVQQLIEQRGNEATLVPTYTFPPTLAAVDFQNTSTTAAQSLPPAIILISLLAVSIIFGGLAILRRRI